METYIFPVSNKHPTARSMISGAAQFKPDTGLTPFLYPHLRTQFRLKSLFQTHPVSQTNELQYPQWERIYTFGLWD